MPKLKKVAVVHWTDSEENFIVLYAWRKGGVSYFQDLNLIPDGTEQFSPRKPSYWKSPRALKVFLTRNPEAGIVIDEYEEQVDGFV